MCQRKMRIVTVFTCRTPRFSHLSVFGGTIKNETMQVLVVEDERRMAELLRRGLEEEGHSVSVAADGAQGLSMAQSYSFDVIVLDVLLPKLDGLAVTRRLRQQRNQTPILMLTARDSMSDVVDGLDVGADDYLTKPFALEVLLARLRSVSRRGPIPQPVTLAFHDLTLNPATHEVFRGNRRIVLTKTEYNLLELLLRRAGAVVRRETLMELVWGFDSDVQNNTLDAFVRLLRNKVDGEAEKRLIQTVRGVGYCLAVDA